MTESLEAFLAFLEMIGECRSAVESAVESHAREALHDELLRGTISELDELATHYYVEDTQIETLTLAALSVATLPRGLLTYCAFRLRR